MCVRILLFTRPFILGFCLAAFFKNSSNEKAYCSALTSMLQNIEASIVDKTIY